MIKVTINPGFQFDSYAFFKLNNTHMIGIGACNIFSVFQLGLNCFNCLVIQLNTQRAKKYLRRLKRVRDWFSKKTIIISKNKYDVK